MVDHRLAPIILNVGCSDLSQLELRNAWLNLGPNQLSQLGLC